MKYSPSSRFIPPIFPQLIDEVEVIFFMSLNGNSFLICVSIIRIHKCVPFCSGENCPETDNTTGADFTNMIIINFRRFTFNPVELRGRGPK